jgi:putative ABC transport system substrate-binding protein
MIKRIFKILFLLILSPGLAAAGQGIVAIQSIRVKPYEEAYKGFERACHCKVRRIVHSEGKGIDVLEQINRIRPDMVLAIGRDALLRVKKIKDIPVVYVMVLNPQSILSGEKNITGVSMNIPPDKQLMPLLKALPKTKTIGLLYDPKRTGYFVKKARVAALGMGIRLEAKEIHNSRDVPSHIMDMKGKIDVFWMLPDITVVTPETMEFLLLFSFENNIPLLTFSEKYLELGAFMSMGIDAIDMGVQAGQMASKILSGRDVKNIQRVHARKMIVSTNLMIAGKLGINLNIAGISGTETNEKIVRNAWEVN